jgi:hypothetical protein
VSIRLTAFALEGVHMHVSKSLDDAVTSLEGGRLPGVDRLVGRLEAPAAVLGRGRRGDAPVQAP